MVRVIAYRIADGSTILRIIINGEEASLSSPLNDEEVVAILNFLRIVGDVQVENHILYS